MNRMTRPVRPALAAVLATLLAVVLAGCAQTQVDEAGRALSGFISEAAKSVKASAGGAPASASGAGSASPPSSVPSSAPTAAPASAGAGATTGGALASLPAAAGRPRAAAPGAQLVQLPTGGVVASAFGVTGDSAGNTIVVGYAIGVVPPKKRQRDGGFVAKYRSSGELAWITMPPIREPDRMDGSDAPTAGVEALAVATDAAGGIYVGGRMRQGSRGPDAQFTAFVARLDGDGNLLWSRPFGSGSRAIDEVRALAVDRSGNVYAAGVAGGYFPRRPPSGGFRSFVVKLSAKGEIAWSQQFSGDPAALAEGAFAVAVGAGGEAIAAGVGQGSLFKDAGRRGVGFMARLPAAGDAPRLVPLPQSKEDDGILAAALSADGRSLYVAGTSPTINGRQVMASGVVSRIEVDSGRVAWTRRIDAQRIAPNSLVGDRAMAVAVHPLAIAVSADGASVAVAGRSRGDLPGAPFPHVPGRPLHPAAAAFVSVYSAAGDLQWTRQWKSTAVDSLESVAQGIAYIGDRLVVVGQSGGSLVDNTVTTGAYAFMATMPARP